METIQFKTTIAKEQVIRPPEGVVLPTGNIEVTIWSFSPSETADTDPLSETRRWLLVLAEEAEREGPDLPSDMAEHHDHYAHGKLSPMFHGTSRHRRLAFIGPL